MKLQKTVRSKYSLKLFLLVVGIIGIVAFSTIDIILIASKSIKSIKSTQSRVFPKQIDLKISIRLKIPEINVDVAIEPLGLTVDQSSMDAPKNPADAAWFNLGPRPGENGSAVISGHYGWKNGIPAIFDNLHKLQNGDKLYIEDEKGATTTFVVSEVRTYSQNEDASDVFTSSDGKAHLNLITCEGVWDKVSKSYSNRLVVFSKKEAE